MCLEQESLSQRTADRPDWSKVNQESTSTLLPRYPTDLSCFRHERACGFLLSKCLFACNRRALLQIWVTALHFYFVFNPLCLCIRGKHNRITQPPASESGDLPQDSRLCMPAERHTRRLTLHFSLFSSCIPQSTLTPGDHALLFLSSWSAFPAAPYHS